MAEASRSGATELDRRLMAAALRLGRRHLGRTFPNPAVGALIVQPQPDGIHVVARGWTGFGGTPHAERAALDEARLAARGATVYVTLEPCAHHGRTPPCADALIAAGVGRVVSAMEDPDPRVAGKGHQRLADAGIPVLTGVLESEARWHHAGHITRVTLGRPHVTLKLAVSADGMIGRAGGDRMIISGRPAFDRVQAMRAETDAVMIGIGTVLVDNPRLTVRHPGLENRSPIRVVLDRTARIATSTLLVQTAGNVPLWIIVGSDAPAERRAALEAAGATVIEVNQGTGGLDIAAALIALGSRGITRVLAEGGSRVAGSLVAAGFADEVVLFRASVVVGPDGVRALGGRALSAVERSPRYRLVEDSVIGEDRMLRYLRSG
jgi:diaminohydroxyphosphoribosylaminopyrimidine deaminase/5-amino-6-(5-phosphoribosylamino)uracil reductase